jgi:hypothetical protein
MTSRISIQGCLALIGFTILVGNGSIARPLIRKAYGNEGFREMKWGISVEQAAKVYGGLDFKKYVVAGGKDEPLKVYVRRGEQGEIGGVAFGSIEYWFRANRFYKVRAVLHSKIGPRTLVSRAESAFEKLTATLKDQYGDPSGDKVDYVTEFIVVMKEATWTVDHSAITVKYEGARRNNEDLLTLVMQEKPEH